MVILPYKGGFRCAAFYRNGKNPKSLSITPARNSEKVIVWKDHGSGVSGDLIDLVMLHNPNLTFPQAKDIVHGKEIRCDAPLYESTVTYKKGIDYTLETVTHGALFAYAYKRGISKLVIRFFL